MVASYRHAIAKLKTNEIKSSSFFQVCLPLEELSRSEETGEMWKFRRRLREVNVPKIGQHNMEIINTCREEFKFSLLSQQISVRTLNLWNLMVLKLTL